MQILKLENTEYPKLLKEISNPPKILYVDGKLDNSPAVAIVGTRKPTPYGIETARFFARELAARGIVIVSGLAFGIDKTSHEACLDAGGRTIAVLASGVDRITPTSHERLGKRIAGQGALVSEFPPGTDPLPEMFPQRNRIISGLSLGAIVIEAPEKSGALITARFAAEQNREVFVVPGSIFSPNYKGSHGLIQEGAKLITSADDILEELAMEPLIKNRVLDESLPSTAKKILESLKEKDGITLDEIARSLGTPINEINAHLTTLEMKRYIRKENEKIYLRVT